MKIELEVDPTDLMITVIETPAIYWCHRIEAQPTPVGYTQPWYGDPKFWNSSFCLHVHFDRPDEVEGAGNGVALITNRMMQEGLQKWADEQPSNFGDFISGDWDAVTADTFWQFVVLGEEVYG